MNPVMMLTSQADWVGRTDTCRFMLQLGLGYSWAHSEAPYRSSATSGD